MFSKGKWESTKENSGKGSRLEKLEEKEKAHQGLFLKKDRSPACRPGDYRLLQTCTCVVKEWSGPQSWEQFRGTRPGLQTRLQPLCATVALLRDRGLKSERHFPLTMPCILNFLIISSSSFHLSLSSLYFSFSSLLIICFLCSFLFFSQSFALFFFFSFSIS